MFTPVESSFGAFLLHLSTTHLLLNTGRVLGASSILSDAFYKPDLRSVPLLAGMGISALGTYYFDAWWRPTYAGAPEVFGRWTWVVCGALVGVGTKYSNGCTSGHMLCGIPLGSLRSVVAAVTFSTTCLMTAAAAGMYTASPCGSTPCYTPVYPSTGRVKSLLAIVSTAAIITYSSISLLHKLPQRSAEVLSSIWSGALFSLGLMIAGMGNPTKPLGFFSMITDGGKRWDPSFLMIPVFGLLPNFLVWRRFIGKSNTAPRGGWHIPARKDVDWKLIAGSAVFGVGWGFLGVCPGPGIIGGYLGGWKGASWVAGFLLGSTVLEKFTHPQYDAGHPDRSSCSKASLRYWDVGGGVKRGFKQRGWKF